MSNWRLNASLWCCFPACIAVMCYECTAHLVWLVWHTFRLSWAAVLSAVCRVWWEMCVSSVLYFWQECVCGTTVLCTADRDKMIQTPRVIHLDRFSEAVWNARSVSCGNRWTWFINHRRRVLQITGRSSVMFEQTCGGGRWLILSRFYAAVTKQVPLHLAGTANHHT